MPRDSTPGDDEPRPTDDEIELAARRFLEVAQDVHNKCRSRFEGYSEIKGVCYQRLDRVKKIDRVVEKIKTNKLSGPEQLVDVSGFRFVTYFPSEVADVVFNLITRSDTSKPVKVKIHSSRPTSDPLSVSSYVTKRLDGLPNVTVEMSQSSTNYSSVHIIFSEAVDSPKHEVKAISIEVQVRSIMEELWGAIDHRLRYGIARGATGDDWQRHLNILKTIFDGIMQYIDEIKIQSDRDSSSPPVEVRKARSVNTPQSEMERLKDLPDELRGELKAAYTLWQAADDTKGAGGDPGMFHQAGLAFSKLRVSAKKFALPPDLEKRFTVLTKAEEAYMRLYTGNSGDLALVIQLCEEIIDLEPANVVAYYRLGLATRRIGELDEGKKNLQKAFRLVETDKDLASDTRRALRFDILRALSISEWKTFEDSTRPDAERVKALTSAIQIAKDVFEHGEGEAKRDALNDLLYCSWEHRNALRDGKLEGLPQPAISDADFERYCNELGEIIGDGDTIYEHLDTLQRAYLEVGNKSKAVEFALRVRDKLEQRARKKNPQLDLPTDKASYRWTGLVLETLKDADQKDTLMFAQELLRTQS